MKKKWWIIGGVLVAVIVVLAVYFISQGRNSGTTTPNEEKSVTVGTIQTPDGPKIKVIFNGPPELKASWEKVGMAPDGFQVQLIGTLKNVSEKAVKFSEIAFLLDDHQVANDNGRTLKPGEQMKITKGFPAVVPGLDEYAKVLEVQVKGFEVIGGSTTTTEPTTIAKPTTPNSTNQALAHKENPTTPGETIITFLSLACEGEYEKATKLFDPNFPIGPAEISTLQNSWESEVMKGRMAIRIEITKEEIAGDSATVSDMIYFSNGERDGFNGWKLKKINGRWRIMN